MFQNQKGTELNTYMKNQRQSLKQFERIDEYSDEDRDSGQRSNSLDKNENSALNDILA